MANNPGIVGTDAKDATSSLNGNSAEAQQFFDRLISPPSLAFEGYYSTLIDALVTGGVWSLLDALWLHGTYHQTVALINLKSASFQATEPVDVSPFTANSGFSPNGSPAGIEYGFNPSVGSRNFTRDNACWFLWNLPTSTNGNLFYLYGGTQLTFSNGTSISGWGINNADSLNGGVIPDTSGFWLANRTGASAAALYRNNAQVATSSASSAALTSATPHNGGGGDGSARIMVVGFGASLSAAQQTSLYNALLAWKTSVGAA